MNKKNKYGLIMIIVIISLCVLGLTGYIIYDKLNEKKLSNDSSTTITISKEENSNVINYEQLTCNSEKCDIKSFGNVEISLKKTLDTEYSYEYYLLYINDKPVSNISKVKSLPVLKIIFLDKNYVFVEYGDHVGDGFYKYYIYDIEAKETYDFSKLNSLEIDSLMSVNYENDVFSVISANYSPDYPYYVCKYDEKDIVYSEEEFKYLGDGKIGDRNVISTKTSGEVIRERYNMSCKEIINSTSDDLEYERDSIKNLLDEE